MTLGGTVMGVTAALVVAGGASCLSLLNSNVGSPDAMSGGQSVVYKMESASELKSNKWETAETAFAATEDSSVLTIDHAPRETDSVPMHRSGERLAFVTERDSALDQNQLETALHAQQVRPQSLPVKEPLIKLAEFDAAPFPYDGGGALRCGSSGQAGAAARRSAHRQDLREHADHNRRLQRRLFAHRLLLIHWRPRQKSRARRSSARRRLWPARQICDMD